MPFQLILSENIDDPTKAVGENVFLEDLPSNSKVYVFYYPDAQPNTDLENKLRDLGNITGGNLFVNIGRLDDPDYDKIVHAFNITDLPVIVITAIDNFAFSPLTAATAFVRISDKNLLKSPDSTIQCIQTIFNLFLEGKVSDAIRHASGSSRHALLSRIKDTITHGLTGIWSFISDLEISFSLLDGQFTLKRSGGD